MRTVGWLSLILLATALAVPAPEELRFEAEEWSTPRDAWQLNGNSDEKWVLWTEEEDVDKKRSKGASLRSPVAVEDRATPEEGAPPLHTHCTGIPPGVYDISLASIARTLAISLDGTNWRPYRGGMVATKVEITDGTFDFWVDDRYAHPDHPGPAYYDCLIFRRRAD